MNNMNKLLEQRICTKNGIRYIKDNKYYIDCMAPTKIYRFIYDIKEVKNVQDEIKRNEKLINEDLAETKELISKLRKIYDNHEEIKKVNEIRDRLSELDLHIILHKTNIDGLKNKKYVIKIAEKPSEMKVIQRKKIDEKPDEITEEEIDSAADEVIEEVEEKEEEEKVEEEVEEEAKEKDAKKKKNKKGKKGGASKSKDYLDNIDLIEYDEEIEKPKKKSIRDFDMPFADEDEVDEMLSEINEDIRYQDVPVSTEENLEISEYY
jgi:hypothetical protein